MSSASIVRLEQDLGARSLGRAGRERAHAAVGHGGSVSRISRWRVQSPPRSTSLGTPGSGMMRAERAAAAGELERGDVVLDAVVVAGEGGRAQQVDGAVGADEAAAGERRAGGDEQCGGCRGKSQQASHGRDLPAGGPIGGPVRVTQAGRGSRRISSAGPPAGASDSLEEHPQQQDDRRDHQRPGANGLAADAERIRHRADERAQQTNEDQHQRQR